MTRFKSPFGEAVIVADGMGGMRGGATAAATVVRMLPELLSQYSAAPPVEALRRSVQQINEEIYRLGHGGDAGVAHMGTTIVLALLREDGEVIVGNVGDSRAYLFRDQTLRQITKDHSAVQRLVDAGAISPDEARSHPESSVLTRAIGQLPEVQLELYPPIQLRPGDGLLLCSDGLSGFTASVNVEQILRQQPDPAAAVAALRAHALEAGSDDNITIQYLRVDGGRPTSLPPAESRRSAWLPWVPAAALCCLTCTMAAWMLTSRIATRTLDLRISNATGEQVPRSREAAPDRPPAPPKRPETKPGNVAVYVGSVRPAWLQQERKAACVQIQQLSHTAIARQFAGLNPVETHVLYRKESAAAKDCLLKAIPELSRAHITASSTLPKELDVLVLLPEPPTADL
jgi:protein phosphatase